MTSPKTYDGKCNRIRGMIEISPYIKNMVSRYINSEGTEADYQRIQEAFQNHLMGKGKMTSKRSFNSEGKTETSARHMSQTLARWLQKEAFPERTGMFLPMATPSASETPEMRAQYMADLHLTRYGGPLTTKLALA